MIDFKSKKVLQEAKIIKFKKVGFRIFSKKAWILIIEKNDGIAATRKLKAKLNSVGLWAVHDVYYGNYILYPKGLTNYTNCSWLPLGKNILEHYNQRSL